MGTHRARSLCLLCSRFAERQDLFGISVVLASRIGAKADPGQILTSQIVYALLGNTGGFEFAPAGEHKLKGISGLQKLYVVNWRE